MTAASGPASAVTTTARSSLARTERIAERWPRSANCLADDESASPSVAASLSCTTSVCAATYARRRVGLLGVDRFTTESGSALLKPYVHSRACVESGWSVEGGSVARGEGRRRRRSRDTPKEAHSFSSRETIERPREGRVDGGRTSACAIVRAGAVAALVTSRAGAECPTEWPRLGKRSLTGLSSPSQRTASSRFVVSLSMTCLRANVSRFLSPSSDFSRQVRLPRARRAFGEEGASRLGRSRRDAPPG